MCACHPNARKQIWPKLQPTSAFLNSGMCSPHEPNIRYLQRKSKAPFFPRDIQEELQVGTNTALRDPRDTFETWDWQRASFYMPFPPDKGQRLREAAARCNSPQDKPPTKGVRYRLKLTSFSLYCLNQRCPHEGCHLSPLDHRRVA